MPPRKRPNRQTSPPRDAAPNAELAATLRQLLQEMLPAMIPSSPHEIES